MKEKLTKDESFNEDDAEFDDEEDRIKVREEPSV